MKRIFSSRFGAILNILLHLAAVLLLLVPMLASVPATPVKAQVTYTQPTINQQFVPFSIVPGAFTQLKIFIYNENIDFGLINVAWTDTLPAALKIGPLGVTVDTCGGASIATPGTSVISYSGGIVAKKTTGAPAQCEVWVQVTSIVPGTHIANIPQGALPPGAPAGSMTANDDAALGLSLYNPQQANATLLVSTVAAPSVTKSFAPGTIWAGETSTLALVIRNNDLATDLTNVSLTDNLPLNVTVVSAGSSQCGGAISFGTSILPSPFAGRDYVTLTGGTVIKNTTCTINVTVTSSTQGVWTNNIPAGPAGPGSIRTDQGVTNTSASNSPTLTVQQLGLTKAFVPASIVAGSTSVVTITLQNPSTVAYTGIRVTDYLPTGLTVVGTPTPNQCGGTVDSGISAFPRPNVGRSYVELTGGTLAASTAVPPYTPPPAFPLSTCTITFTVLADKNLPTGNLPNTIAPADVSMTGGLTLRVAVTTNLAIQTGLTVAKAFGTPTTIVVGAPNTVTITLRNYTAAPLTGVTFTDIFPSLNLKLVAAPAASQCGGGTVSSGTNVGGFDWVTLTGGVIPAPVAPATFGSCTVTFQVTSAVAGTYSNNTGNVSTTEGVGVGGATTTPTLTVLATGNPVVVSKAYQTNPIVAGAPTRLTITITAPSDAAVTALRLTDILPAGLRIVANAGNVTTCRVGLPPTPGALASLSVPVGGDTISLGTPNGAALAVGANCTITVYVTGDTPGVYNNHILQSNVTTAEGRTLAADTPLVPLTITSLTINKNFAPATVNVNGKSRLTINLINNNTSPLTNIWVQDASMGINGTNSVVIATPPNVTTDCNFLSTPSFATTIANGTLFEMTGGSMKGQVGGVSATCFLSVDVVGKYVSGALPVTLTNTLATNRVSAVVESTGTTINPVAQATSTLTINNLSFAVVKQFNPPLVYGGAASLLSVELHNLNSVTLTGINFTDDMSRLTAPGEMIIADPASLNTGSCGGVLTGSPGDTSFGFSGGSLLAGGVCTLTLRVTLTVTGNRDNWIPSGTVKADGGVSNGLLGDPADVGGIKVTLSNLAGVSVSKAFAPNPIAVGDYSLLTITIKNLSGITVTGMGLVDELLTTGVLPNGLSIASGGSTPAVTTNCTGGSLASTVAPQHIELSGATLANNATCTIVVPVTSTLAGNYQNTIPKDTLTNDQGNKNPEPAVDTLNVLTGASLGDYVWEDLNQNGQQDDGATGIDGVTVNLYRPGYGPDGIAGNGDDANIVKTMPTAGGGKYLFTNLVASNYVVEFIPPTGYTLSPADQGANATDSDANTTTGRTTTIPLAAGANDLTWDAGMFQTADLAVIKDDGVANVNTGSSTIYTLTLTNNGPSAANNATIHDALAAGLTKTLLGVCTAGGGAVCPAAGFGVGELNIASLEAGTVVVPTLPSGGSISFTVTANVTATSGTVTNTFTATTPAGTVDPTPANNTAPDTDTVLFASIGDFVWNDLDNDGIQDAGETGIPGVTVKLYNVATGLQVGANATTGGAGDYLFTNLVPGNYYVVFTPPVGYTISPMDAGADDTVDSDANTVTGQTGNYTLVAGTPNLTVDAGMFQPTADLVVTKDDSTPTVITGGTTIYTLTLTNNGPSAADNATISDPAVAGLTKTPIVACTAAGGAVCPAIGFGVGELNIATLEAGTVRVPTLPSGGSISFAVTVNVTATGGTVTNTFTATPPAGTTDPTPATASDTDTVLFASIGDFVWNDLDNDGIQDAGETGIPGVTVKLYDVTTGLQVGANATTGGAGDYLFTNLVPGDYYVVFTPPVGYSISPMDAGVDDTVDSDANTVTGQTGNYTLVANVPNLTVDAGMFPSAPALSVSKTVTSTGPYLFGSTITYDIVVTNTGNLPLTGVSVTDPGTGVTLGTCSPVSPATLALGAAMTCPASHVVIQADVTAGNYSNTATGHSNETPDSTATATVPIAATPLIGVAKAATFVAAPALPGRWDVTYQILVRNYGNVPLSAVQVTDNLLATFPPLTTFTLLPGSVTSTTLTVNPGFNGTTDTDLLTGVNTLAVGASGTITLKVRVTPLIAGPFNNTATGYGTPPVGDTVDDDSMDGVDPDPAPKDGDPTNNDLPTPVTFGPAIFDPPVGFKTFDASGLPLLQWQMVWINNANFSAIDVQVDDPIPAGTIYSPTYPATGILPLVPLPDDSAVGVSCTTPPLSTTTTDYCYYEGPSFSYPLGRIRWQGNLGADLGAVDAATAANELLITFNINVPTGITSAYNVATSHTDRTGLGLSPTTATDPVPVSSRWPTSTMGGGGDDPGDSQGFSKLKKLPSTGFAPGIVSLLPLQPEGLAYSAYSDLRVEIPSLKVNVDIVGVPWKNDDWDITWLGGNAGYLDGTAFPTWLGNSVITGHVYAADGLPGPFVNLGKLKWGDRVVIHAFGQKYIYEVRSVRTVSPYNNSVLGHKEEAWVTLLTCKDYNDLTGQYKMRTAVQAVLITVVDE